MNEAYSALLERRSCRAYTDQQISPQILAQILEAGTYAPTGMGRQSPLIVVVRNPEQREQVERLNAAVLGNPQAKPFYGAPTLVVVFGDSSVPFGVSDGNLVIGNLLNAAHALGVDSCYIWRAREVFSGEVGQALKKAWGIPAHYEGVGNVILGYGKPEGIRKAPARKEDYIRYID